MKPSSAPFAMAAGILLATFRLPPRLPRSRLRNSPRRSISASRPRKSPSRPEFPRADRHHDLRRARLQCRPYLLAIGAYDIVVTLEGPMDKVTVRRKEKSSALINRESMSFLRAPESYSISSTRLVDSIAAPIELYARNVGVNHLKLVPRRRRQRHGARIPRCLPAAQESQNLYQTKSGGVTFVSNSLFQARSRSRPTFRTASIVVHAYLFKHGEFVMDKTLTLCGSRPVSNS